MQDDFKGMRLFELKKPIEEALESLGPHLSEIELNWRTLLESSALTENEIEALAGVNISEESASLRAGRFDLYRADLEQKAEELEKQGIPEKCAVASLGYYLESCLPFLNGNHAGAKSPK